MVGEIGGGRVAFSRTPKNLGLAGCWNTCIDRARGKWVHLFHQDDLILPSFYKAMAKADASSENIGAAFCRHAWCDGEGKRDRTSELHLQESGVLPHFLETIAVNQQIQTPAVVVRKSVYKALGGYRSDLRYVLDWEMWQRIASRYAFWFEPEVLAVYRIHESAETSKLRHQALIGPDFLKMLQICSPYYPQTFGKKLNREARKMYSKVTEYDARKAVCKGEWRLAGTSFLQSAIICFDWGTPFAFLNLLALAFRIYLSKAKRAMKACIP
jgi:glycosyltransferase involved in cell wall biosynthesis